MQVILGSGGVIADGLEEALSRYTDELRLVSRNPRMRRPENQICAADLTDAAQTARAVDGAEVAYLTVGLEYKTRVWERQWPLVMANVITACKASRTKLVFFDNVYPYGKVDGWMHEDTPADPVGRKGAVRAQVATMLLEEMRTIRIQALIARSADFYGPNARTSFFTQMVLLPLKRGKRASWMVNANAKHSLTFVPDAVKALALLGNTEDAFQQIWHLPTDRQPLTGHQLIELAAEHLAVQPKYSVLKPWMMKMAGFFSSAADESRELLYQFEDDYLFDSRKFEERFFTPSRYRDAMRITVDALAEPVPGGAVYPEERA